MKKAGYKGILCAIYESVYADNKVTFASLHSTESAFVSFGFKNWNKGKQKLSNQDRCASHKFAISHLATTSNLLPIEAQLSESQNKSQIHARCCLLKIVSSLLYLARQGVPIRGNKDSESNAKQLLSLMAEDDSGLRKWIDQKDSYTKYINAVTNSILLQIKQLYRFYSIIIDGTIDLSGSDQKCICIRFVDNDVNLKVEFIGLYETENTSGEGLYAIVKDVLCRLNLSMDNHRGEAYRWRS